MTHLPYILASYGLAAAMAIVLSLGAALRLRRARARLAALEQTATPRPVQATPAS
ncbi:heme exporter protein CcmD [Acetobacter vaccinii]|uniref:Heme exporter protein CcmD n=1 Tax=Acetobacter vaccinii TaxID=2592655 RepID=A0A5C1YML8_9PROT|nr:heme exporter protein CcmD [Acetobacter vaccinii]QEO16490.1 heme exporter protein CcmD [Acetobacter vaccinii]